MDLNLWKNKEELKKYLDNLGIEYRYGCLEEKNTETCHLLGDYLLSIEKANQKASQIYKSNCDEGKFGLSCDAYGRMAYRGLAVADSTEPNLELALSYFVKGCDLDEPRACYHGGQLLGVVDKSINRVIPPQPQKALRMLKQSCFSGKEPAACTLVHSFYLRGFHDEPADLKQASEYAKIACDQNEYAGCFNLSRMYHLGEGVEVDQQKSKFYRQRAMEILGNFDKAKHMESIKGATPDL